MRCAQTCPGPVDAGSASAGALRGRLAGRGAPDAAPRGACKFHLACRSHSVLGLWLHTQHAATVCSRALARPQWIQARRNATAA